MYRPFKGKLNLVRLLLLLLTVFLPVAKGCFLLRYVDCKDAAQCPIEGYREFVWSFRVDTISVKQKYSTSSCEDNYFIKRGVIHQIDGCRAKYQVVSCVRGRLLPCSDTTGSNGFHVCKIPMADEVMYMELWKPANNMTECEYDNYGIAFDSIWVNRGCQGTFFVCYR